MVKINLITVMRLLLWSLILVECNRVPVRSVGDNPTPVQPDLSAAYPDSMVYVPAGTFSMGVPANQADDNLGHLVYLDAYYIQRDEVTNEQYATFLNEAFALGRIRVEFGAVIVNGIEALDCTDAQVRWTGERFEVESGKRSHPMIEVTWFGAQAYAEYYGMRLPTEAEWEKAARGTDQRKFPWGNSEPTSLHGNINNVIGETTPVGFFSPVGDSPWDALIWLEMSLNGVKTGILFRMPIRIPEAPKLESIVWQGVDHSTCQAILQNVHIDFMIVPIINARLMDFGVLKTFPTFPSNNLLL